MIVGNVTNGGVLLGKTELYAAGSLAYLDYSWTFTDRGFLAVGVGTYMNLVILEDWETFAYVPSCWGYLKEADCFCCLAGSNRDRVGLFPRYTLPELLSYAETVLNGWDLSPAQRQRYGIDR